MNIVVTSLLAVGLEENFVESCGEQQFRWVHDKVQEAVLSRDEAFLSSPSNGCVGLINRVSTWALAPLPGRNFFFAISIGIAQERAFRFFGNEI
jgi:hypothetical protein